MKYLLVYVLGALTVLAIRDAQAEDTTPCTPEQPAPPATKKEAAKPRFPLGPYLD